ncbi:5-oxoprolinase subunit PxpB [Zunongwangia sp.]|uniref:5-oxoprolinase subunit PxpB n=1 Tax=Zunongwangia sp. TaxID=1965325 RepID=UPI003AA88BB0
MDSTYPKISKLGEQSILIQFTPKISEALLDEILYIQEKLKRFYKDKNVEISNSYREILVLYNSELINIESDFKDLKKLLAGITYNTKQKKEQTIFEIPVCYDAQFGIDLDYISNTNHIAVSDIIKLHTQALYRVYFMGFLPGFLYLGGLNKKLHISRKSQPRLKIEKGAVGIGEQQTGIYPQESPGGWQIIGNCPIDFFDKSKEVPSPIQAGDFIKFFPVSIAEYKDIKEKVKQQQYQLKSTKYDR